MAGETKKARPKRTASPSKAAKASVSSNHPTSEEKPLRPSQCRTYMRRTLAKEFRGIVDGFVKGAQSGSCQHVKLATELLEPQRRTKQPQAQSGRNVLSKWLQELDQEGRS